MSDIAALSEEYGIPRRVIFNAGNGGLPFAELVNERGRAVVALQGGQLLSWVPQGEDEVIWLSQAAKFAAGKSIRGGAPVCWPWFGPHPQEDSFPAHGFARTAPWQVLAAEAACQDTTTLSLRLVQGEAVRQFWPYATELEIHFHLGEQLGIELVTRNTGTAPISISEALHTYFNIGDIREISVHGLDNCEYLDKVDGYARKRQRGSVAFGGEIDRIYVDTADDCLINDPRLNRRIRISKQGSRSTVVWNPWDEKAAKMGDLGGDGYLKMVCVESGNAADNKVSIAPGAEHRLAVGYRLEALDAQHP